MNKEDNHPHISIISPEYKGEKMVQELVNRCVAAVTAITYDYEIILVNDASPDNTWAEIEKVCAKNTKVKGINLSRNFGQHYAITAGLTYATGDWVIVMDCDLQDRPEEIPNLYNKAQEGWDIVQTRRIVKHVGWWKRMSSIWFHSVISWLSGSKTYASLGNFGIYKRNVIEAIKSIPQEARSLGILLDMVGFKKTYYDVEQDPRGEGTSSYTIAKLFSLAMNMIIVKTNKPLRFAVALGFFMSFVSFLLALYNIIAKIVGLIDLTGFTTTIFSIWFVGGLMLLVMGILGLYIGKIFDQVKGHPLYIVSDILNLER